MSDHDALVAAILAHPAEDTPRLALADWLDEHQQSARAAYIRDSIERDALSGFDPRRRELVRRTAAGDKALRKEWAKAFPRVAWHPAVRRGFVDEFSMIPGTFLAHFDEVAARVPLTGVKLIGRWGGPGLVFPPGDVLRSPLVSRVRRFSFDTAPAGDALRDFVQSGRGANLASLTFSHAGVTREVLAALDDPAAQMPALRELRMDDTRSDGNWRLPALALSQLESLHIDSHHSTFDPLRQVAAHDAPSPLRRLFLRMYPDHGGHERVDADFPELATAFFRSPVVSGLTELSLSLCRRPVGDILARAVAESPGAAGLRVLALPSNRITNAGAKALAESPHLGELWHLDLVWNEIVTAGQVALEKRFGKAVCRFV